MIMADPRSEKVRQLEKELEEHLCYFPKKRKERAKLKAALEKARKEALNVPR